MEEMEEEAPLEEQEQAATKMQAMFKGKKTRDQKMIPTSPKTPTKKRLSLGGKKRSSVQQTKQAHEDEQAQLQALLHKHEALARSFGTATTPRGVRHHDFA